MKPSKHLQNNDVFLKAYRLMEVSKAITDFYENNFKKVSKYVHATSRGHEAIQLAVGLQLMPQDIAFPYYRDESMLLGMGLQPHQLMLQLLAKRDDPFSGGRSYYCHPSLKDKDKPKIPHQSSATGMQGIPATGAALGIQYKEKINIDDQRSLNAIVVCSFGDASITEGEVAEAFQMAALKQLPILYLVQDNGWDISANAEETRAQDASYYARGFKGLETRTIDGSNFLESYETIKEVIEIMRNERRPFLVHAKVPLLNHHTSGVRKEWYRDDLEEHALNDPLPKLRKFLLDHKMINENEIKEIEKYAQDYVAAEFIIAEQSEDPQPSDLFLHEFAPTPIVEETGDRSPANADSKLMVDCALFAIEELMNKHNECLLYGQDVGARLGGVFREAATLAQKFSEARVFNTPIQEAFIVGSTVGMSAVGLKPIVEVQFADYIWPALNQLFTEVARSCYLTNGKYPVSMILRVPIGAYGSGGPYHSSSVESVLCNIKGIKVVYPSNGADLKGLFKAAYYDPNPVVILEHKGLYWSKVPGTEFAKGIEPAEDYVLPLGKANLVLQADEKLVEQGDSIAIITYGMGVHWALNAAESLSGQVSILDLRTLYPLDEQAIYDLAKKHGKILVITEEPRDNSFAQSIAARIQEHCFEYLDAPVRTLGSENLPAIPLNSTLEMTMIPSAKKVLQAMIDLLKY
ncbi:MAG: tungsten formylmethanofuran dehydrogenase [Saprospiraceae bacterium]|nr:tungsten formylmethanofuran dehydrogenase [Saprospiraceae bacterium]